jgi:hypothetical protein
LNLKPGQNGKLILISRGSYIDINIYIYTLGGGGVEWCSLQAILVGEKLARHVQGIPFMATSILTGRRRERIERKKEMRKRE